MTQLLESEGGRLQAKARCAVAVFRFTITRDLTESAEVEIAASDIKTAQQKALDLARKGKIQTWQLDDGPCSDAYLPDPGEWTAVTDDPRTHMVLQEVQNWLIKRTPGGRIYVETKPELAQQHVDWPFWDDKVECVLWDFPERVPQYVKDALVAYLKETR